MTSPPYVCGIRTLRSYVAANQFDPIRMPTAAFRGWLWAQMASRSWDLVFQQRLFIRNLLQEHRGAWQPLRDVVEETEAAYEASPDYRELDNLNRTRKGACHAVEGIGKALANRAGDSPAANKRPAANERPATDAAREPDDPLEQKLRHFQSRIEACDEQIECLRANSAVLRQLDRARGALLAFEDQIGLTEAQRRLEELHEQTARRAERAGTSFAERVRPVVAGEVARQVLRRPRNANLPAHVAVLAGVKLGAARVELDYVVVRTRAGGVPVEVLAVVEVKRNPDDIAHGFQIRQENLAWLTGWQPGYDAAEYRTGTFRKGHFDQAAEHHEEGIAYRFAASSFRYFRPDAEGRFLRRLFFVCDSRPLRGLGNPIYSRLLFRLSTDLDLDLDDEASLAGLQAWIAENSSPYQTKDVLALYLRNPILARHIVQIRGGVQ